MGGVYREPSGYCACTDATSAQARTVKGLDTIILMGKKAMERKGRKDYWTLEGAEGGSQ
jgi:hypothetical protein